MDLKSFKLYPTAIQEGTCSTMLNFSNRSFFNFFFRTVIWELYDEVKEWAQGRVRIDANSKLLPIIEVQKKDTAGEEPFGFVAIDDILQENTENCGIMPPNALPTQPPPIDDWANCNFQDGLCGWMLSGPIDDEMFYWNRTNGGELESMNLAGPIVDHEEHKDGRVLQI